MQHCTSRTTHRQLLAINSSSDVAH
jgi:hypothetical protein